MHVFLTLVSCSLHGLIRGENMELGRDSDTGGQVRLIPIMSHWLFVEIVLLVTIKIVLDLILSFFF